MSTETPSSAYGHLFDGVESAQQRAKAFAEGSNAGTIAPAAPAKLGELEQAVVRITKELFPGKVSIRAIDDPDYPGDSYTVVEAQATGAVEDIVDRQILWHQRVAELSAHCESLCLSLSD